MDKKLLYVYADTHHKIKVKAAKAGMPMTEYVKQLVEGEKMTSSHRLKSGVSKGGKKDGRD